eukprot:CAMPEP_0119116278 /NCGR_PEP_ID=MMETSP1180-20130426/52194_1 /TAXON_ID=3052 ORGANISM="Chlamydomonas cf sp, Strain CCMP681" /NCGR_SAMPLE_ID=MMETSP1180 /ASSEMBLY_ACC=CAM_ASM_000741 /LENGTH=132 /DNA_ID=CAMNT_0007105407 /DNA_START=320 /DNA_END=719 /DNA_ORIENTATION=+
MSAFDDAKLVMHADPEQHISDPASKNSHTRTCSRLAERDPWLEIAKSPELPESLSSRHHQRQINHGVRPSSNQDAGLRCLAGRPIGWLPTLAALAHLLAWLASHTGSVGPSAGVAGVAVPWFMASHISCIAC